MGNLLSLPSIKALIEEHKALKDGRIYRGIVSKEVRVKRGKTGWVIMMFGTEANQRDILRRDLERLGLSADVAEWVAGRCPSNLLPDRDLTRLMVALRSNDDYFSDGYFRDDYSGSVAQWIEDMI